MTVEAKSTTGYTVYRLYDAERNLLYVGCTSSLERRLRNHSNLRAWWPDVADVETETFANAGEAADYELQQAQELRPRHNSRRMPYIPPSAVKIGQRLRELRRRKFLTQVELAEKAGVSQRAITQIERDKVEPHITTMRKLAAALGVDPRDLLED